MGKKFFVYLWKIVNNCMFKFRYEEEYRVLLKEKVLLCSGKYYILFLCYFLIMIYDFFLKNRYLNCNIILILLMFYFFMS